MKSIFTCLMLVCNLFVLAQDTSNVVTANTIKPIKEALKANKTFKPFLAELSFVKTEGNVLLVETADKAWAATIKSVQLVQKDNEDNKESGTIDSKKGNLYISLDNFKDMQPKEDVLFLQIKITGEKMITIGNLVKSGKVVITVVPPPPASAGPAVNYMAIIKQLKLQLALKDLYPTGACCSDSDNPCDSDTKKISNGNVGTIALNPNKNKIVYYANTNQTIYYKHDGTPEEIDRQKIQVKAGRPLALEIRNINPDAFKVEITDTAIAYNITVDTLLKFLPGVSSSDALTQQTDKPISEKDKASAVFLVAYINLREFFMRLQHGCIYEFNKNTERKIEALKRFDQYLADNYPDQSNTGLNQLLVNKLDTVGSKINKGLFDNVLALYNRLPASYYRMIANIPAVPHDKDKIIFTFNILARENTPYMSMVKNKSIDAYIVKNFRIDVSSGLYYAFNMGNAKYTTRADSIVGRNAANTADSTLKTGTGIIREKGDYGEFGFASFIHFYKRYSADFSWGFHLGAGLSLNDKLKPRYFSGISFIVGHDDRRIAFNMGIVGGNVDKLSDQYPKAANGSFIMLPSTETSLITKTRFAVQPFLSISYNLPFRNKAKATEKVTPPDEGAKKPADDKKDTQAKTATTAGSTAKEEAALNQESNKPKKTVTTTTTTYK